MPLTAVQYNHQRIALLVHVCYLLMRRIYHFGLYLPSLLACEYKSIYLVLKQIPTTERYYEVQGEIDTHNEREKERRKRL